MVAGLTNGSVKLQTALVAPLPTPIDVKTDIVLQGKADKWQRELKSALRTRNLLRACEEEPPELMGGTIGIVQSNRPWRSRCANAVSPPRSMTTLRVANIAL